MIMDELLDILMEAGKRRPGNLPEPQQKFYDYIVGIDKRHVNVDLIIKNEAFFWILSDGTAAFSGSGGGLHHADGARLADTTMGQMMKTGAIRGTFFDRVGLEVQKGARITREQIVTAQYMIGKTNGEAIIDITADVSSGDESDFVAWYYIDRHISNDLLGEILNGGGSVKKFQKSMDEILKIDGEIEEGIINGSPSTLMEIRVNPGDNFGFINKNGVMINVGKSEDRHDKFATKYLTKHFPDEPIVDSPSIIYMNLTGSARFSISSSNSVSISFVGSVTDLQLTTIQELADMSEEFWWHDESSQDNWGEDIQSMRSHVRRKGNHD